MGDLFFARSSILISKGQWFIVLLGRTQNNIFGWPILNTASHIKMLFFPLSHPSGKNELQFQLKTHRLNVMITPYITSLSFYLNALRRVGKKKEKKKKVTYPRQVCDMVRTLLPPPTPLTLPRCCPHGSSAGWKAAHDVHLFIPGIILPTSSRLETSRTLSIISLSWGGIFSGLFG